jgi:hypothetical protein
MKSWITKLISRKFLLSAISMAAGIAALCGADATVVSVVAGASMIVLPALVYCVTEGRIDAASVHAAKEAVMDAAESLGAGETVQNIIGATGDLLAAMDETAQQ